MSVVFYHIPKNAGTAIVNGLKQCKNFRRANSKGSDHSRISENPPKPGEISFIVLRDPVDRFISMYYHLRDMSHPDHAYHDDNCDVCSQTQIEKKFKFNIHHFPDVNDFARAIYFKSHPYHDEAYRIYSELPLFKSQYYWVSDQYGVSKKLNIILYQSRLVQEFPKIEKLIGCKMTWPSGIEANQRLTREKYYVNEMTRSIVHYLYKDDYTYFTF